MFGKSLSFHGAIVGMAAGCMIFAKRHKVSPFEITDACVVAGAQGIFLEEWGISLMVSFMGVLPNPP